MEQKLHVISIREGIDMGSRNYGAETKTFTISELKKGEKLLAGESWGQPDPTDANYTVHLEWFLQVMELDEDKMVFDFSGEQMSLNRHWQVLGTSSYGIPNAMVHMSKRFIFFFATDEKSEESQFDALQGIYDQMSENESHGDYWKNIPLAKEALHLLKDIAPEEDDDIKAQFCELVVDEELLDKLTTPRLLLSFMDLWHVLHKNTYHWEEETYDLLQMIDPKVTEEEKTKIMQKGRSLRYDPVQLSQAWEDHIYEVESECDELLKDEPRHMGFCYRYWATKREVLERHGIHWKTPANMNPRVRFD